MMEKGKQHAHLKAGMTTLLKDLSYRAKQKHGNTDAHRKKRVQEGKEKKARRKVRVKKVDLGWHEGGTHRIRSFRGKQKGKGVVRSHGNF